MALTYQLIASNTLSSPTSSVTFSGIPSTYTDLALRMSCRSTRTGSVVSVMYYQFNGTTSTIESGTWLHFFFGGSTSSERDSNTADSQLGYIPAGDSTANTFSNVEMYLPSYTAAQSKSFSVITAAENNNNNPVGLSMYAGLYRSNSPITSITINDLIASFAANSTFWLYGIRNT